MLPTVRTFPTPPNMPMQPERAQELGWASESSEVASQRQRESMEVRASSCRVRQGPKKPEGYPQRVKWPAAGWTSLCDIKY